MTAELTLEEAIAWCDANAVTINCEGPAPMARTPMTPWATGATLVDAVRALMTVQDDADRAGVQARYETVLGRKFQKLARRTS